MKALDLYFALVSLDKRFGLKLSEICLYQPPLFKLSETHINKKHFLGFSPLPDDH